MVSVFIAVTDQMSWGRGLSSWDAIGNSIFLVQRPDLIETIVVFEVQCKNRGAAVLPFVNVNDDGAIVAPAGSSVTQRAMIQPASEIVESFLDMKVLVDKETGK